MQCDIKTLLICVLCLPLVIDGNYFLPTIFWDPASPALHSAYWSKAVDVQIFQMLTFLCPNNDVSLVPFKASNTRSYYNLYVREVSPEDTDLDYDTICDPKQSRHVFSCNKTRKTILDFNQQGTDGSFIQFEINVNQADPKHPNFKLGMDYIFFSTSNGHQDSLLTDSTKCTMVFRIHICRESNKTCAIPFCSTFGRDKACVAMSTLSNAPREVRVTANDSNSLSISWKPPLNTDNAVGYYSICYRTNTSQACETQLVEANVTSAVLNNLNSSTEYLIRVRAVSCEGAGNYSTEITHKTQENLKTTTEPPRTTAATTSTARPTLKEPTVCSAPKQVSASSITSSSVTVSWKRPNVIVGDLIYYSLCVQAVDKILDQNCDNTSLFEPTKLSAVIYSLEANTSYRIRVRAHNCQKPGNYSADLIVSTNVSRSQLTEPSLQKQSSCGGSSIDSVSLVVGIIIGAIAAIGVVAVIWILRNKARRERITQKATLKNVTNRGYRSSVSGVNTLDKKNDKNLNCTMPMELNSISS